LKKGATLQDAQHFIDSLLMDGEEIDASYIWAARPLSFMVVTNLRCIGTQTAQVGEAIIVSVPFDQIASVSVTISHGVSTLDEDPAPYIFIHLSYGDTLSINGNRDAAEALLVYDALIENTSKTPRAEVVQ
jgi:hypothetical protein